MPCAALGTATRSVPSQGAGVVLPASSPQAGTVGVLFDPDALAAVAARLTGHATSVRDRARVLAVASSDTGWRGRAAAVFAAEADDTVAALHAAANRLDDAAVALRRHIVAAEHTRELLRAAERAVVAQERAAAHGLVSGLHDTVAVTGAVVGGVERVAVGGLEHVAGG